ncbi:MAG: OmpA family protein [Pseudomonadota bacterium]
MSHRRRQPRQEPAGDDRWLVSYADFVTLLFALFVVMYAVARSNADQLGQLSRDLASVFDARPRALEPIQVGDPVLASSPRVVGAPAAAAADPHEGDTRIEPTVDRLEEHFAGIDGIEPPAAAQNTDWLEISLSAELLFGSGDASLRQGARRVLREVAVFLAGFDNPVTVEGYTDNVPVRSRRFPSNWELSAARASQVARFLEARGIERRRLSAVGYGENHPTATNATPEGRASNRRVNIIVARRGNLGRNRNAAGQGSAFAHVRQGAPASLDDVVREVRKPDGGVLFTNEADDRL